MSKNNSCIRLLADEKQIKRIKETLQEVERDLQRTAAVLNLAGNEVRLKILYAISKEQELCPCDLSDILEMSIPAVSQHLRKLKDGGVIEGNRMGQTIFYSICADKKDLLNQLFKEFSGQLVTN
jgi:DNA-binding transcriptional ArsR family regulator